MAETYYRTQVSLPMDSANPADAVVNRWHMRRFSITAEATVVDAWHDALQVMYNGMASILSPLIDPTLVRMKTYDLEDAEPRQPVLDEFRTITAPTAGASLPAECCMVLSERGAFTSGVNPASRRNRQFIGPLKVSTIEDAGNSTKFTAAARDNLMNNADLLKAASDGSGDWRWIVYSETIRTASGFPTAIADVISGHVDNAVDIQRRRGVRATTRSTFT